MWKSHNFFWFSVKSISQKNCRKIQWPSILTTTNSGFWLAEKSVSNQPPTTWIRTHYEKLRKEDNKKWLIDNESKKTETDLVTLTGRLSKWKFSWIDEFFLFTFFSLIPKCTIKYFFLLKVVYDIFTRHARFCVFY